MTSQKENSLKNGRKEEEEGEDNQKVAKVVSMYQSIKTVLSICYIPSVCFIAGD